MSNTLTYIISCSGPFRTMSKLFSEPVLNFGSVYRFVHLQVYCENEDEEPWADDEEEEWESDDVTEECKETQGPAHLPRRTPLKGLKGSEGAHLRYTEEGGEHPILLCVHARTNVQISSPWW